MDRGSAAGGRTGNTGVVSLAPTNYLLCHSGANPDKMATVADATKPQPPEVKKAGKTWRFQRMTTDGDGKVETGRAGIEPPTPAFSVRCSTN